MQCLRFEAFVSEILHLSFVSFSFRFAETFRTFLSNDQHSIQFHLCRWLVRIFLQPTIFPFYCNWDCCRLTTSYYAGDISCRWWRYMQVFFFSKRKTRTKPLAKQLRRWCFSLFLLLNILHRFTKQCKWGDNHTPSEYSSLVRCNFVQSVECSAAHLVFCPNHNENCRWAGRCWSAIRWITIKMRKIMKVMELK